MDTTLGSSWRKPREEGILHQFPSGNVARIRPIGLDLFIKLGYIPELLMPMVLKLFNEGMAEKPAAESLDQSKEWIAFLDSLVSVAFVTPAVKDEPQGDDQIHIDDVEWEDKLDLFELLGEPARKLVPFRSEQTDAVAVVEVQPAAAQADQRSAGRDPMGKSNSRNARHVGSAIPG